MSFFPIYKSSMVKLNLTLIIRVFKLTFHVKISIIFLRAIKVKLVITRKVPSKLGKPIELLHTWNYLQSAWSIHLTLCSRTTLVYATHFLMNYRVIPDFKYFRRTCYINTFLMLLIIMCWSTHRIKIRIYLIYNKVYKEIAIPNTEWYIKVVFLLLTLDRLCCVMVGYAITHHFRIV